MDSNFMPIFSKCDVRTFTLLHAPTNMLIVIHARPVVELYLIDHKEHIKITDLNEEIGRLKRSAQKKYDIVFDPQTKEMHKVNKIPNQQLVRILDGIHNIICNHFGIGWFDGEPMVMTLNMFNEWCDKNYHHGVELEHVH